MSERGAVLVTGGAGYIGSHACKALARRGYRPVTLDSMINGRADFVRWGPLIEGDIADAPLVLSILKRHGIESALHFAALAEVEQSMREPALYYENNLAKSIAFIGALTGGGIRRLVFSSTCAVYGLADRRRIVEDLPPRPVNPYGESKLAVERMLEAYDRAYGLRSVSLRYFNAAGADPEGEIGEWPRRQTRLIPRVIEAAMGSAPDLVIYGDDYPTRDGTAVRDYVHVEDIVEAHLRALDYLGAGGETVALNLGTGEGRSVREVLAAAEEVTGRQIPHRVAPRRAGDPPELVADPRRAAELLGWRPVRSELGDIVGSAWRWQRGLAERAATRREPPVP
jgi:UDP-arabinose 4-epimerase